MPSIRIDKDMNSSLYWDTSGLPEGDQYVYGVIDDGVNAPVMVYSSGAITVDHGNGGGGEPPAEGGTPSIIYHYADHLTGSNVDTDDAGNIIQLLDYYPYGDVRLDEQSSSYENDYKFTGKEKDEDTGLYYYEARYYDSGIGRFTAIDPMAKLSPETFLKDPQQLNSYTYVRNNPLGAIDPDGLLTIFIHGTVLPGKSRNSFSSSYMNRVTSDLGDKSSAAFNWSGKNSTEARANGARSLQGFISNYNFSEGEQLNIVAHSHGGNVAIEAINSGLGRKVDTLLTLGTPVHDNYFLSDKDSTVVDFINVYHRSDNVQIAGKVAYPPMSIRGRFRHALEKAVNLRARGGNFYWSSNKFHSWLRTSDAWNNSIKDQLVNLGILKAETNEDGIPELHDDGSSKTTKNDDN